MTDNCRIITGCIRQKTDTDTFNTVCIRFSSDRNRIRIFRNGIYPYCNCSICTCTVIIIISFCRMIFFMLGSYRQIVNFIIFHFIFYFSTDRIYFTVQCFQLCHVDRIRVFTAGSHSRNLSGQTGITVSYGNITGRCFPRSKQFILLCFCCRHIIKCFIFFFLQIRIVRKLC